MAIGIFTLRQQLRGLLSGNWPNAKTPYVEYLVVGGGGGGGYYAGGGGGAGGVITGYTDVTPGVTYNITIGGGGASANSSGSGSTNNPGTNGVNSVLIATSSGATSGRIVGVGGGGGGGGLPGTGLAGASGGGASRYASTSSGLAGSNVFGQGNVGGGGTATGQGGGGGGAGTAGIFGTGGTAAPGGAGIASAISGTVTPYGGGGAAYPNVTGSNGGVGGGGNYGASGSANTGGGAGGDSITGAGGSGIVIVSYPDNYAALTTTTGSPTVSTSGSGSLYLNNPSGAANQSLYYTNTSATALGAGDFCIEAFVWWSSSSGAAPYVITNFSGSTNFLWGIYQQSTLSFYVYGGVNLNSSTLFTNNAWNHLVICRTSGTTSMFLNGTRRATASDSVTYTYSNLYVGQNGAGTNFMNGYLSNFRIVVGNSIYNAAATTITVPTAPFTATSQTKFLLSTVSPNAVLDSSVSSLTPTLVSNSGSVSWNQESPFATGLGYKNRVYTWAPTVSAGGTATGTFTV